MHQVRQENAFYSDSSAALTALQRQRPDSRTYCLQLDRDDVEPFVRTHPWPVGACPIILSPARTADFERLIGQLPRLMLKAIKCMFERKPQAFAAYLGESPVIYGMLMDPDFAFGQMYNRHDVVFSNGHLKLLEVNAGCTAGGWQGDMLVPQFDQSLRRFPEMAGLAVHHRYVLDALFAGVLAAMVRVKPTTARGNVLVYLPADESLALEVIRKRYQLAVKATGLPCLQNGKICFFSDFGEVAFGSDHSVRFDGAVMDAVLVTEPAGDVLPLAIHEQFSKAHITENIVMPDNVAYTVFGNKMLIALLHEPALQSHFSASERAFIQRYIPFTARLQSATVSWHGKQWTPAQLLSAHKDAFVIKKAHSLQGRDVMIGRFASAEAWARMIERVQDQDDWLMQEFCPVDTFCAPDNDGNMIDYSLIWGIFDAGNTYGGAFARAMPVGAHGGVINSARGAVEFYVYEESVHEF